MFELKEQKAKLTAFIPKIGKRSGDKEPNPEADLVLSMGVDNGFLSELHPSLKSAFYKKDEGPDANEVFSNSENELKKLKFDDLIPSITIKGKSVGMALAISYGIDSTIESDNATVKGVRISMQEGGTIIVQFTVSLELSGRDAGRIFESLLGNEIDITLTKPTSPQATLIQDE